MPVRRLALGLALAVLAALAVPASAGAPRGISTMIGTPYGGTMRTFNLYVAPRVPAQRPVPLLLVLHGLFHEAATAEAMSGLDRVADEEDVAVAYPAGVEQSWNAGTCCGSSSSAKVDDVGFLTHVVDLVAQIRPIDRNRVYVAGFSNGGMMALKAACERPDVFAAAASVGGTLQTRCAGKGPVSALMLNGKLDTTVPYGGTAYSRFLHTRLTPVPTAMRTLATHAGCVAVRDARHPRYTTRNYRGCARGTALKLVTAPGLGHRWPTTASHDIDAERIVWGFLSAQRRVAR